MGRAPTAPLGLPSPQRRRVEGRKIAEKVICSFPTCPIPEIARLVRTLKRWRQPFLAYFDTGCSK